MVFFAGCYWSVGNFIRITTYLHNLLNLMHVREFLLKDAMVFVNVKKRKEERREITGRPRKKKPTGVREKKNPRSHFLLIRDTICISLEYFVKSVTFFFRGRFVFFSRTPCISQYYYSYVLVQVRSRYRGPTSSLLQK